jgi:hypothetical protein
LQVIITAANTVSRASVAVSEPPDTISVTISATSIHGDRDSEDERSERLADSVSNHFGVMHGRQHRAGQEPSDDHEHRRRRFAPPGRDQHQHRERRDRDGPTQQPQRIRQSDPDRVPAQAPCAPPPNVPQ